MPEQDDDVLAELKKIRELLTPAPPAPPPKGLTKEFKAFLETYKVLGLAVAFILGLYLGNLVKALVGDLVLPILSPLLPKGTSVDTYQVGPFLVGDFALNLLTFILVALVIFLIVKLANKYKIS
ncbi:MAG TPA: MscL family protein [Nitrososphaerales archaeon]|nr:MscL family protein [Nitrososphaerales archaeon]